jgi:hypothetical protein
MRVYPFKDLLSLSKSCFPSLLVLEIMMMAVTLDPLGMQWMTTVDADVAPDAASLSFLTLETSALVRTAAPMEAHPFVLLATVSWNKYQRYGPAVAGVVDRAIMIGLSATATMSFHLGMVHELSHMVSPFR